MVKSDEKYLNAAITYHYSSKNKTKKIVSDFRASIFI